MRHVEPRQTSGTRSARQYATCDARTDERDEMIAALDRAPISPERRARRRALVVGIALVLYVVGSLAYIVATGQSHP